MYFEFKFLTFHHLCLCLILLIFYAIKDNVLIFLLLSPHMTVILYPLAVKKVSKNDDITHVMVLLH